MSSEKSDLLEWFSSFRKRPEIWFQIWNPPKTGPSEPGCGRVLPSSPPSALWQKPSGHWLEEKQGKCTGWLKPEFNLMEMESSSNCSKQFISSMSQETLKCRILWCRQELVFKLHSCDALQRCRQNPEAVQPAPSRRVWQAGASTGKSRYAETYAVLTPGPANAHPSSPQRTRSLAFRERKTSGYILNSSWLFVTLM